MSGCRRSIPSHARDADDVYALLVEYLNGVTVRKLMEDHSDRLKDANSVLAAIDLLEKERKVNRVVTPGKPHHLDSITALVIFWASEVGLLINSPDEHRTDTLRPTKPTSLP